MKMIVGDFGIPTIRHRVVQTAARLVFAATKDWEELRGEL
jgi:hypothetical protein